MPAINPTSTPNKTHVFPSSYLSVSPLFGVALLCIVTLLLLPLLLLLTMLLERLEMSMMCNDFTNSLMECARARPANLHNGSGKLAMGQESHHTNENEMDDLISE